MEGGEALDQHVSHVDLHVHIFRIKRVKNVHSKMQLEISQLPFS